MMKHKRLILTGGLISVLTVGILAFLAWWVRREPEPATAMESVLSYWEKWSDDVVRETVRAYMEASESPASEALEGAAATIGGSYAIRLYREGIERFPSEASLKFGLIRQYFSATEDTAEVVLTAGGPGNGNPVEENLPLILKELTAAEKVDPGNASVDYLRAYLSLVYGKAPFEDVLGLLDRAKSKPVFDDYSLAAGKRRADLLVLAGFPEREARFATIQHSENPLRDVWSQLGERLESGGRRLVLEADQKNAERAFLHLSAFGERLSGMRGWMQEGLNGLRFQMIGYHALTDLCGSAERAEEMKIWKERAEEARYLYNLMQPFTWYRARRKLEVLSADEFLTYLHVFLSHGGLKANKILLSGEW